MDRDKKRARDRRYRATAKGRASRRRYEATEKAHERQHRWYETGGWLVRRGNAARLAARDDGDTPCPDQRGGRSVCSTP